jgi:hypothetical protein
LASRGARSVFRWSHFHQGTSCYLFHLPVKACVARDIPAPGNPVSTGSIAAYPISEESHAMGA